MTPGFPVFSNFVTSCQCVYEKLEKHLAWSFWTRPWMLLVCHSASKSETLRLLCHVIVRERGTPRASSVDAQQEFCGVASRFCSRLPERRVVRGVNGPSSRHGDFYQTKRGNNENAKTVAEFLGTLRCHDFCGLFRPCSRPNELQNYRFGH